MTQPVRQFPFIAREILAIVADLAGGTTHIGTRTPATFTVANTPFVRVRRGGGGSSRINDFPIIDVDVFDPSFDRAEKLAEKIRQRLTRPRCSPRIDRVVCENGPQELEWSGASIARIGATYTAVTRTVPAPP